MSKIHNKVAGAQAPSSRGKSPAPNYSVRSFVRSICFSGKKLCYHGYLSGVTKTKTPEN